MREFTQENYPMSDRALFEQFLHSNQNAYLSFKKCADLERMFQRNKYKDTNKPKRQIRQEQLIKELSNSMQNRTMDGRDQSRELSVKQNDRYSKMEGD